MDEGSPWDARAARVWDSAGRNLVCMLGEETSVRRTGWVLATMALAMLLASGVALAEVFNGDDGNNRLVGTDGRDRMFGGGGDDLMRGLDGQDRMGGGDGGDTMYGGRGQDAMNGGGGEDRIYGGPGDDYISSISDDAVDQVDCGGGRDTVDRSLVIGPDKADVFVDCEKSAG